MAKDDETNKRLDRIETKLESLGEGQQEVNVRLAKFESVLENHMTQDERMVGMIERIDDKLVDTNHRLKEYNSQLEVHIAGVKELRVTNELLKKEIELNRTAHDTRLQMLEKPYIWASTTVKIAKWITAIGGSAGVIIGLLKLISKVF